MDGSSWHCTGDRDQDHPHGKEMQKAKWLSGEALQIAVKEREAKSKVANIHWIIKKARELQKNICF